MAHAPIVVTRIEDVIVPESFSAYQAENSLVSTALFQSGVAVRNGIIDAQLRAGAQSFTVPFWSDLGDDEANISSDDPTVFSTPHKITAAAQVIRKVFANQSWSEMSLAGELAGSDPLARIQDRVNAYWDRQMEKRLLNSLMGVMYANIAQNGGDMVVNVSIADPSAANAANMFSSTAVSNAALTLGDRMDDVRAIAMHSAIYGQLLNNNNIEVIQDSEGRNVKTYRGMAVIVDDNLTPAAGVYTTILFGAGAVGYGITDPEAGYGTEVFRSPDSGNGGGGTTLFSRVNLAIHPEGFAWNDGSGPGAVVGVSPTLANLLTPARWSRVVAQRKAIKLAFLVTN